MFIKLFSPLLYYIGLTYHCKRRVKRDLIFYGMINFLPYFYKFKWVVKIQADKYVCLKLNILKLKFKGYNILY